MFNRRYGFRGQSIIYTQDDYDIMSAADDRNTTLREMVAGDTSDFYIMLNRMRYSWDWAQHS
jgi:hypothetical protein